MHGDAAVAGLQLWLSFELIGGLLALQHQQSNSLLTMSFQ